jgi:hypothetical protein
MELAGKFAGLFGSDVIDPRFQARFDASSVQASPEYMVAGPAGNVPAGAIMNTMPRALQRGIMYGDKIAGPAPGLSSVSKDPLNQAAWAAIEAGGRYLPRIGTAIQVINAGPTATYDTLDPAAAAMRQRMMRR